jgi:hypothetical protein
MAFSTFFPSTRNSPATQRKEELQAKLRQIEAEMTAVATGTKRPQTVARKAAPKKPKPTPLVAGKPSSIPQRDSAEGWSDQITGPKDNR